jgi:predicted ATP-grasp superfamily ATP-dependent carboligase
MDRSAGACVIGDADMVAPLVRAGVRCAVVAPRRDPVRRSRRVRYLGWADPWDEPDALLRLLRAYAEGEPDAPVLYFQSDEAALFVSRHREQLAQRFRFHIADATSIDDLVDKFRFRALADRLGLPVPASGLLDTGTGPVLDTALEFPIVVKPATRGDSRWGDLERDQKALHVQDRTALEALWPRLESYGAPLLAQQLVPGPETSIESYHCYVDAAGDLVAEFTGRKVRTRPVAYGHTTALTTTDAGDVRELGRQVVTAVGLTGVAKCDFKRGPDGRLWLLEVNPRFNLWHHAGAVAGVNLPALVHADLTGAPRPPLSAATPGVCWMSMADLQAARASGMTLREWLAFAWRCPTRSNVAWDDPAPFLHLAVHRVRRSLSRG